MPFRREHGWRKHEICHELGENRRSHSRSFPKVRTLPVRVQDGSSKDISVVTKTAYFRPKHPKILCPHCHEYPEVFRREHELRRHTDRVHGAVIDASRRKKIILFPISRNNDCFSLLRIPNSKSDFPISDADERIRRAHLDYTLLSPVRWKLDPMSPSLLGGGWQAMMGSNELQGVPFMQRPDVRGQDGPGGPAHSTSGINDIPLKEVEDWKRADPFSMIGVAATCPSFLLVLGTSSRFGSFMNS